MSHTELQKLIHATFDDFRLSRNEKRALKQLAQNVAENQHQLNVVRSEVFAIAREEMLSPDQKRISDWIEDVLKAIESAVRPIAVEKFQTEVLFSPEEACALKIVSTIQRARKNIDVCVFTITDDRISDALMSAYQRGIVIRILTDDLKARDFGSDVFSMDRIGVEVRTDDNPQSHMHHKFAVVDRHWLLTGSYNWTRSASNVNEENLIITNDANLTNEFQNHFESLWDKFA